MDIDSSVFFLADKVETKIWGMPEWVCWVLIGVLLVFTGMFAASENAFSNCNKYHFRAEADKGNRTAKLITKLVDKFDNTLVTILVSSNTVATIMSYLSAMLWYNIAQANNWGDGLEAVMSTVVMGFFFYVISDTIPKVISKSIPDQMAVIMAYPITFLQYLLFPIVLIFRGLLFLVHKAFHLKDENLLSKEDLLHQVKEAVNEETVVPEEEKKPDKLFEKDETVLMDHVFSFDQKRVRQVYTPIEKVFAIDMEGLTAEKLNQEVQKTEYNRIPIYEEKKENIIGILVFKIYFEKYIKDPHLSIPSVLEKVVYLEADMNLDDAFEKLNSEKVHLGVVKDQGKVVGIISMTDILEELVDDISEDASALPEKEVKHV